jgi:hypothetical protein
MKTTVFWDVTPCGSCENRRFVGTSVHTIATRHHIPEDGSVNSHCRESDNGQYWVIVLASSERVLASGRYLTSKSRAESGLKSRRRYKNDGLLHVVRTNVRRQNSRT